MRPLMKVAIALDDSLISAASLETVRPCMRSARTLSLLAFSAFEAMVAVCVWMGEEERFVGAKEGWRGIVERKTGREGVYPGV
jgi:hypothetical protein